MTAGAPAAFAAAIAIPSSSSAVWVSMMMASTPPETSASACSAKAFRNQRLGNLAVGLHQTAEGTDVAENVSLPLAKRPAGDLDAGAVDLAHPAFLVVPLEHDAGGAEGIGDEAIGAGLHVGLLDREDLLGRVDVPGLAAAAGRKPRLLELGSHGAVPEKDAVFQGFEKLQAAFLRNLQRQSQRAQGESDRILGPVYGEDRVDRTQHSRRKKLDLLGRDERIELRLVLDAGIPCVRGFSRSRARPRGARRRRPRDGRESTLRRRDPLPRASRPRLRLRCPR